MMTSEQVEALTAMTADRTKLRQHVAKLRGTMQNIADNLRYKNFGVDDFYRRVTVDKLEAALAETKEPASKP